MMPTIKEIIDNDINIKIVDYFYYYTNFGGLNKFIEINGTRTLLDEQFVMNNVITVAKNILNFSSKLNYFITLQNEDNKEINSINDIKPNKIDGTISNLIHKYDFLLESNFLERINNKELLIVNISGIHKFNLASVEHIFKQIILLDEFFVQDDLTRVYKIDNMFYFLNYGNKKT